MTRSIGFDLVFPQAQLKSALVVSLLSVWVLVGVFYYLNRFTHRRYFAIWNVAWLFYALWLTLTFQFPWDTANPWLNMIKHWCIGIAAAFLLWGSGDLLGQRKRQRLMSLFIGFLLVWSYVGAQHLENPWAIQVPIFVLIGVSSVVTGLCFAQFRRTAGYLGAGLLSPGFLLWGGFLITYPWWQVSEDLISTSFFIAAALQLFIAVSMIVLVLEEARRNLQRAVRQWHNEHLTNHQLQHQILSSEEEYRQLFEQASVGILLVKRESRQILDGNPEARRLLEPEGALPLNRDFLTYFDLDVPVGTLKGSAGLECLLAKRRWTLRRADPRKSILVEIEGGPLRYHGEAVFQIFLHDCSDRVLLEQQLQRAEKMSALGQMIAGIAHELNNPLAVIQGYLELILKRHKLPPQTRADLEKVGHESQRAAKLVAQFLSFAREQPSQRKPVDLNALVRQVVELRRFDFQRARVEVDLELDPELPPAKADPEQIHQVLVNLIQNSVQVMEHQNRPARLKLSSCRGREGARVLVEDSGPGIPESLATRIYDPFFTTKEVGKGTGLGLAIVHSIMVAHEGRIAYQPSALGGAGFALDLPVWTVEQPPQRADAIDLVSEPEPESQPVAASILVLDDEPALADMIAEMLRCLGHTPTVYNRPEAAIEALRQQPFDLILSDFRMPSMNGQQFYWAVRRWHAEMARRIVFLSGDVLNDDTRAFLKAINGAFIAKPFRLAAVESTVSQHLARFGVKPVLEVELDRLPVNAQLPISVKIPSLGNSFPQKEINEPGLQPA